MLKTSLSVAADECKAKKPAWRVKDGTEMCDLRLFSKLRDERKKEDTTVAGGARGSQECF